MSKQRELLDAGTAKIDEGLNLLREAAIYMKESGNSSYVDVWMIVNKLIQATKPLRERHVSIQLASLDDEEG